MLTTALFLVDIDETAVFYWLTSTAALFQLVDAVDFQKYRQSPIFSLVTKNIF